MSDERDRHVRDESDRDAAPSRSVPTERDDEGPQEDDEEFCPTDYHRFFSIEPDEIARLNKAYADLQSLRERLEPYERRAFRKCVMVMAGLEAPGSPS